MVRVPMTMRQRSACALGRSPGSRATRPIRSPFTQAVDRFVGIEGARGKQAGRRSGRPRVLEVKLRST